MKPRKAAVDSADANVRFIENSKGLMPGVSGRVPNVRDLPEFPRLPAAGTAGANSERQWVSPTFSDSGADGCEVAPRCSPGTESLRMGLGSMPTSRNVNRTPDVCGRATPEINARTTMTEILVISENRYSNAECLQ